MNPVILVAQREMAAKMRSRAYVIVTALMFLLAVAGPFAVKAIGDSSENKSLSVITTTSDAAFAAQLKTEFAAVASPITLSTDTDAKARQAVKDGKADAFVQTSANGVTIFSKDSPSATLLTITKQVNSQLILASQIKALGGDPAAVQQKVAAAKVTTVALGSEKTDAVDGGRIIVGMATGVLIFISIMSTGTMVANGVVEEKSSRVVEIILSTIKPFQLLAGKLLGLCIVGVLQMLAFGIGAYIGVTASGTELAFSFGASVIWFLVYYLLGYAVYSIMLGAAASLVSRLEDVGSVLSPFNFLMMIPYIYGVSVLPQGDNTVGQIGSLIPFFSPFIMPIRIALGYAQPWEIITSLALALITIPILLKFGARVFKNSVLRSGARIKWKDALTSA